MNPTRTTIEEWAVRLERTLHNVRDVASIGVTPEGVEVIVWSESAARSVWRAATRLQIPDDALAVIRPVAFLQPYPGQDARNAAAYEEFVSSNVKVMDDGRAMLLSSMDAIVGADATVLVLGSMPGVISLERSQYYAHERNRFWQIIEDVFGIPRNASYAARVDSLKATRIALWDVLKHCSRVGSLDSSIDRQTEVPNDIESFLQQHATIRKVLFNGKKAASTYGRLIAAGLSEKTRGRVVTRTLPSTSPANAGISYPMLLETWRTELI